MLYFVGSHQKFECQDVRRNLRSRAWLKVGLPEVDRSELSTVTATVACQNEHQNQKRAAHQQFNCNHSQWFV